MLREGESNPKSTSGTGSPGKVKAILRSSRSSHNVKIEWNRPISLLCSDPTDRQTDTHTNRQTNKQLVYIHNLPNLLAAVMDSMADKAACLSPHAARIQRVHGGITSSCYWLGGELTDMPSDIKCAMCTIIIIIIMQQQVVDPCWTVGLIPSFYRYRFIYAVSTAPSSCSAYMA